MADAKILMHLVDRPDNAEHIADDVAVVKQIIAVSQLIARKLQSEKRYLARLEGRHRLNNAPVMLDMIVTVKERIVPALRRHAYINLCPHTAEDEAALKGKVLIYFANPRVGQKGSDVSARDSTRKIVAASRQLEALQSILSSLGVSPLGTAEQQPIQNNRVNTAYWTPKNTIVRDVLNEIGNQHRHP